MVFFAWGEIYSLFPATCGDTFGRKFAATNYGLLYTAKGTAALIVPLGSVLREATGDWLVVLYVAAGVNLLAAALALFVLKPMRRAFIRRSMDARARERIAAAGAPVAAGRVGVLRVDHLAGHPAVDDEFGAGDEAALRADEPGDEGGDVLGAADPAGRVLGVVFRAQRLPAHVDPAGAHAVGADIGAEAYGERVGERDEAALAGGVALGVRLGLAGAGRCDGHDRAARLPQEILGGAGEQERAGQVGRQDRVPLGKREVAELACGS